MMTTEQSNIVLINDNGDVNPSSYISSDPRVIAMEHETKVGSSKISLFKTLVNEYLRFLIDPTFVVGHIVKIAICLGLLFYILPDNIMKDIMEFKKIIQCVLIAAVGFQIVTSSLRSMLLPIIAIVVAVIADILLKNHSFSVPFNPVAFQYLLATGMLGVGVAVFFRPSV